MKSMLLFVARLRLSMLHDGCAGLALMAQCLLAHVQMSSSD